MKFNLLGGYPTLWEMRGIRLQVSGEVTAITQRDPEGKLLLLRAQEHILFMFYLIPEYSFFLRKNQMNALKDT